MINIAIVLIVLSTVVAISLSLTQPHLNLMNQAGNGFSFDVNIPEKLLHSPSFLSLFAVNSCLLDCAPCFCENVFQNIIDNNIFTPENVKLARYVEYNFIALAFLDSWLQSLCSGS